MPRFHEILIQSSGYNFQHIYEVSSRSERLQLPYSNTICAPYLIKFFDTIFQTSLQSSYVNLPASPAGLLGPFASSGFALAFLVPSFPWTSCFAHSVTLLPQASHLALASYSLPSHAFCAHYNLKSKLSQSTRIALKRIEMQKILPLLTLNGAKPEQWNATLFTPCHFQDLKGCPCQISRRLDQNCGR